MDLKLMMLEHDLHLLMKYAETTECFLNTELDKQEEKMSRLLEAIPECEKAIVYESNLDGIANFDHIFPQLLRSSLFVSCETIFEINIARYTGKEKFESVCDILKTKMGDRFPENLWSDLMNYKKIRNRVVHQKSCLKGENDTLKLFIEDNNEIFDIEGLAIIFRENACRSFISAIRDFFSTLSRELFDPEEQRFINNLLKGKLFDTK